MQPTGADQLSVGVVMGSRAFFPSPPSGNTSMSVMRSRRGDLGRAGCGRGRRSRRIANDEYPVVGPPGPRRPHVRSVGRHEGLHVRQDQADGVKGLQDQLRNFTTPQPPTNSQPPTPNIQLESFGPRELGVELGVAKLWRCGVVPLWRSSVHLLPVGLAGTLLRYIHNACNSASFMPL